MSERSGASARRAYGNGLSIRKQKARPIRLRNLAGLRFNVRQRWGRLALRS